MTKSTAGAARRILPTMHGDVQDPSSFKAKQRIVLLGSASGYAAGLLVTGVLWSMLAPPTVGTTGDRLALAVRCLALPALMLVIGIGHVANLRGLSDAIDPTAGRESPRLIVHGRYVDNTAQQLVLFALVCLGLSVDLEADQLGVLPALAVTFTLGRALFWAGYLRDPLMRAPGMAMTFSTTMIPTMYLAIKRIVLIVA